MGKIYKLLLLLIIVLISFSCSEDDKSNEDIQTIGTASEYMFQENKTYSYDLEAIDADGIRKSELELFSYNTKDIKGIKANHIKFNVETDYFTIRDIYFYSENDKIHGLSSFLNLNPLIDLFLVSESESIENMKWQLAFDFSKPNYISDYELIHNDNFENGSERVEVTANVECIGIKNISYTFNGISDDAVEFSLIQNLSVIEENLEFDTGLMEIYSERRLVFMKGIGIVEDDTNINMKDIFENGEVFEQNIESKMKLKSIK